MLQPKTWEDGLYRLLEKKLENWYQNPHRPPLVLRGARQVGKSTLVKNFCQNNDIQIIELNLERKKLNSFERSDYSIPDVLEEIEVTYKVELIEKPSKKILLFIDEIQEQKNAFGFLRYFFEEVPHLPVIAAGSLLEFLLTEDEISVPVGRIEYLKMGPMSFSEFLLALDENLLVKKMSDWAQKRKTISEVVHKSLLNLFQKYLLVGGMPKAVLMYKKTKSLLQVRKIQKEILQTYKDDFMKYSRKTSQLEMLSKVFDYVPFHLGEKVKYSEIDQDSKSRDLKRAIELLVFAKVITPVVHSNASGLPLSFYKDENVYKLYFLDIGLVGAILETPLHESLAIMDTASGPLAEQFVAQHLQWYLNTDIHFQVFYWMKDKVPSKSEIDFMFQSGTQIYPIEVKAGTAGKLKSLHQFCVEKKTKIAFQISLHPFQVESVQYRIYQNQEKIELSGKLVKLPFYLIEYLLQSLKQTE